ncbi:hypothetical protein QYE76_060238 [Lolium multiflorum]|uniref:Ribonuclease H n=1 Tax=Lolium multiflorum TaxID=4521 RepID=A0AAD8S022_LOLMU|nr:hypothetical protein QYE76_060238 [Lolium multiflorum]
MTYYVVFEGRVPGVYEEWEECKKQVHKFSGNCYKGYPTRHEAVAKWRAHQAKKSKMKTFLVLSLLLTIVAAVLYFILVSKMLECKRDEITDIGFIDPDTMHVRTIEEPLYNRDTPETLLRFHFILIVIKMYEGEVEVFDSLTKEPILYKSCFLMLKSVWESFIKEDQSFQWAPKLTWRANKKCAKQPKGSDLCGYYVCEYIHRIVSERANNERNKELRRKREKISIEERFKAIGEELAGFFLREVIPPSGEYHYA